MPRPESSVVRSGNPFLQCPSVCKRVEVRVERRQCEDCGERTCHESERTRAWLPVLLEGPRGNGLQPAKPRAWAMAFFHTQNKRHEQQVIRPLLQILPTFGAPRYRPGPVDFIRPAMMKLMNGGGRKQGKSGSPAGCNPAWVECSRQNTIAPIMRTPDAMERGSPALPPRPKPLSHSWGTGRLPL